MLLHFESDSFEICGEACGEASMNNINGTMKNLNLQIEVKLLLGLLSVKAVKALCPP